MPYAAGRRYTSACVFDLLFETPNEQGTVFNKSPHSGKQQPQTPEVQDHALGFRNSVWETGLQ